MGFEPGLYWNVINTLVSNCTFRPYVQAEADAEAEAALAKLPEKPPPAHETAKMETLKQRAQLILQYEQAMTTSQLANKQYHPTYLHALVPADDAGEDGVQIDADEAGVINGVKRALAAQRKERRSDQVATDKKIAGLEKKIEESNKLNQEKMDEILAILKGTKA